MECIYAPCGLEMPVIAAFVGGNWVAFSLFAGALHDDVVSGGPVVCKTFKLIAEARLML